MLVFVQSWFHFSFANYYNPANMNFGALRVINDDLIKGPSGFGCALEPLPFSLAVLSLTMGTLHCRKHPHRDAEIFTYIVEGQLSHEDSMGNKEALPRGCVQYLSAGTGITHSVSACCPSACTTSSHDVRSQSFGCLDPCMHDVHEICYMYDKHVICPG